MAVSTLKKAGLELRYISAVIPSGQSYVSKSAPAEAGYEFFMWVGCTTQNWVSYVMPEFLENPTTTFFNLNFGAVSTDSKIRAYYLVRKV